jgi:uncharacterized membrane protein
MLQFTHNYTGPARRIWLAILYYAPNCPEGGDWRKRGWYVIWAGDTVTVYTGDVHRLNRYWCFYALAEDGRYWAGQYKRIGSRRAFDECEGTRFRREDEYEIGFQLLDVGDHEDYNGILRS